MNFFKKPVFISKLSKRQLITFVGFLIILISLPLAIFLVQQQQIYRGRALGPEAVPTNVKIANLHGGGFSVSWTSVNPTTGAFQETTGSVFWGTDQNNLNQEAFDDRGQDISSTTHHVSIFNLNPNTTYYLKIKSGPDNYGKSGESWVKAGVAVQQATPVELTLSGNPQPIYGYIKNQAGNKVEGALVYAKLKKDDSETKSALMSTVTKTDEGWVMDAKNARKQGLDSFFDFDGNDRVLIDVQAAQNEIVSTNFIVSNSSPAPDIIVTLPEQASALKFTSQNIAGGNAYTYWKTLDDATMLSTGDILEYDVYLETNVAGIGGIDLRFTDNTYARDVPGWIDQNGISCHPNRDLTSYAYGKWFHRACKIPSGLNGKVIDWVDLVNELDANTAISAYYDNFIIKNNNGTVKNTIHTQGDPDYNLVDFKNNSSNTGNVVQTTTLPTTPTPTPTPPSSNCPSEPSYPSDKWDRVWCDQAFSKKLADEPDKTEVTFNDDWDAGSVGGIGNDNIGFRSGRVINISQSGVYEFTVGSDDGIRLWIDNELVIDKWIDRAYTTNTINKNIISGSHKFRIDYYEKGGLARVSFSFQKTAEACPSEPSYPSDKWDRVWCDRAFGTKLADEPDKTETTFDENWGGGSVGGIRNDNIGFRSGRTINLLKNGDYQFSLGSDDGSRLWIDGQLIIDVWKDQSYKTQTVQKYLSAGNHQFRIDWYENSGDARVSFSYIEPSPPTPTPTPTSQPPTTYIWEGNDSALRHQLGRAEGSDWWARVDLDNSGFLNYGPYYHGFAEPGGYRVTWKLLIDVHNPGFNDNVLNIDIYDATAQKLLALKQIYRNEFNADWTYQDFNLEFDYILGHDIEFRTWWHDKAYIKLDKITAIKVLK